MKGDVTGIALDLVAIKIGAKQCTERGRSTWSMIILLLGILHKSCMVSISRILHLKSKMDLELNFERGQIVIGTQNADLLSLKHSKSINSHAPFDFPKTVPPSWSLPKFGHTRKDTPSSIVERAQLAKSVERARLSLTCR